MNANIYTPMITQEKQHKKQHNMIKVKWNTVVLLHLLTGEAANCVRQRCTSHNAVFHLSIKCFFGSLLSWFNPGRQLTQLLARSPAAGWGGESEG